MAEKAQPLNVEELLAKATQPSADAMVLHPFYKGKVEIALKCCVRDFNDFAIWYTPGVAASCRAIADDPELVYEHTHKANTVAVVSDGTRVLGLGDIGPKAGLPVMEGKALLYKYLGGVDAWPIMLDTKDPDQIIQTVLMIQPGFGGVNLEDLSQPKCFRVLDTLREQAEIPVWHDDQQGTATVTLAGLINALKIVGKPMDQVEIAFIGSGASNVACARLIFQSGVNPAWRASWTARASCIEGARTSSCARQNMSTSGSSARLPTRKAARATSKTLCAAPMSSSPSQSPVQA